MKRRSIIQLSIVYDDLYAPPEKWKWRDLLDLDPEDDVQVTVIEESTPYSEDDPRFDPELARRLAE